MTTTAIQSCAHAAAFTGWFDGIVLTGTLLTATFAPGVLRQWLYSSMMWTLAQQQDFAGWHIPEMRGLVGEGSGLFEMGNAWL
ncbi:MAG TPA: hypothetical protein VGO08_00260 [Burkholderiales bacterium]|nr:hypothetical protein [Burkholderiales bacterium]